MAWFAEKISVAFTSGTRVSPLRAAKRSRIGQFAMCAHPSQVAVTGSVVICLVAASPAFTVGTFTTTFGDQAAYSRPWAIISSASSDTTSTLIGTSDCQHISWICARRSRTPAFATWLGFVVMPLRTPQDATSFTSSSCAVSRYSFIEKPPLHQQRQVRPPASCLSLTFERPGGQTGDNTPFKQENQHHQWDDRENRRRRKQREIRRKLRLTDGHNSHRQRIGIARRVVQGEKILIPVIDKHNHRRCEQARHHHRQHNAYKGSKARESIDNRRLFRFPRDLLKKRHQD